MSLSNLMKCRHYPIKRVQSADFQVLQIAIEYQIKDMKFITEMHLILKYIPELSQIF